MGYEQPANHAERAADHRPAAGERQRLLEPRQGSARSVAARRSTYPRAVTCCPRRWTKKRRSPTIDQIGVSMIKNHLLLVSVGLCFAMGGEARAACPVNSSKDCITADGCPGKSYCDGLYWGECLGAEPVACTTSCGTSGKKCVGDSVCRGPEKCNGCSDDGDASIDEGVTPPAGSPSCASGCSATWECHGAQGWGCKIYTASCTVCARSGTKECNADGTASTCTAAGAEVCNGCDDNLNGRRDEAPGSLQEFSLKTACNPNGCTTGGTRACVNGALSTCTGCSGTTACMNDCSVGGRVACTSTCEIDANATCIATAEVCGSCDDDGDGVVDEGLSCEPQCAP